MANINVDEKLRLACLALAQPNLVEYEAGWNYRGLISQYCRESIVETVNSASAYFTAFDNYWQPEGKEIRDVINYILVHELGVDISKAYDLSQGTKVLLLLRHGITFNNIATWCVEYYAEEYQQSIPVQIQQ